MSASRIAFVWLSLAMAASAADLTLRLYPFASIMDAIVSGDKESASRGEFVAMGTATTSVKPRTNLDIKKYFVELGVGFPEGSYIHYRAELAGLVMYNTEANQLRLGRLLMIMGHVPRQVEMDFSFVAFPQKRIEAAARELTSAAPAGAQIKALWTKGEGRLVASAKVLTRSGVNAQVQGVQEVIYPTEFETTTFQGTGTNRHDEGAVPGAVTIPGSFETRQVGVIANVTPTLGPDGRLIDLTMVPEYTTLEGWDTYATPVLMAENQKTSGQVQQPSFHTGMATTSIVVEDGGTAVLGGMPSRNGQEWLYLFVTARVVDSRGTASDAFMGYPLDLDGPAAGGRAP